MKAFLMYKGRNFDLEQELPWNEQALTQDLELNTLFNAMALGDEFLFEVSKAAVLSGLNNDLETMLYRQNILKDCLKNPLLIKELYGIAVEAIESRKRHYFHYSICRTPSAILRSAVEVMQVFVGLLKRLRGIADEHADKFESEGFRAFFAMLREELDDEYLASVQDLLRELTFRDGVLLSAELGKGNEGTNYVLRKPRDKKRSWIKQIFAPKPPVYTFYIDERDEGGARALGELKDRGINPVANALAQSADHIENFFKMLRIELAFYIGCLNLHEQLAQLGEPVCFPIPATPAEQRLSAQGLYDVCLALTMKKKIVGNDLHADNKDLVIITGANTSAMDFLRITNAKKTLP